MNRRTWKLTRVGLLGAVAIVLFFIEIPIVAFYKLDLSTMPAILAGFSMGPLAGLAVMVIKDVLHLLVTSTAGVGELADLMMGAAFVLPASLWYARQRSRKGALAGMALGTVCIAVVGALSNYFLLLPFYQNIMPLDAILSMAQKAVPGVRDTLTLVIYITLPFNLFKGVVLSLVTYLLYKPLSPLLHQR